ncbi:1742_t:CDS:10, partial [Entrophospora sp. SA101]
MRRKYGAERLIEYFQMLPPRHDFSRPVPSSAILEIKKINPLNTHFTIKAFVVYKSDIKQWSNNRGQGKLFNVTLMDKSGEIRATAFTFCVDKFYELLKENKAYYMTKLKVALNKNPIYQGHKYELHFENSSEVRLCTDTDSLDSELSFEFVTFEKLLSIDKDTHIVDKSGYEITVTTWRNLIDNLDCTIGSVIIIKSARVSDFRGKGLSTTNSTVLITNPSLPEATELSEWYSTGGSQLEFNSLASQTGGSINIKEAQKSLEEIKSDKTLGRKEKAKNLFILHAVLAKRKYLEVAIIGVVIDVQNHLRLQPTDSAWMNCFDETAALILGMPADDF